LPQGEKPKTGQQIDGPGVDNRASPKAYSRETRPIRTLSLRPLTDVEEIWKAAEWRLGASRERLSLVLSGSKYLAESCALSTLAQLFEIRWRGSGGDPGAIQSWRSVGSDRGRQVRPKRVKPKEQCHLSEEAAVKLREMVRLKLVPRNKRQAIKDWFRRPEGIKGTNRSPRRSKEWG
jgi:hypothetical protein